MPDFSLYAEMSKTIQQYNVFRNRWCGACWQEHGLTVIPTISWGLAPTYDFCFDGVEKGSIVAVGMIGCKFDKTSFMKGYNEMLNHIEPEVILCYGTPFNEMGGNIVKIDYWHKRNGGK